MKKAVLSLSGGMDSTSLLLKLLSEGYQVKAITIDYGQKHFVEVKKAKKMVSYLNSLRYNKKLSFYVIEHHIFNLPLEKLLYSALVTSGVEVPEGHYAEENMKQTVVPNRNKIFSSIIQAVALSWALKTDSNVEIALGIHAGDHTIYPDCRQEFRSNSGGYLCFFHIKQY